jgi:hypothetical protein
MVHNNSTTDRPILEIRTNLTIFQFSFLRFPKIFRARFIARPGIFTEVSDAQAVLYDAGAKANSAFPLVDRYPLVKPA